MGWNSVLVLHHYGRFEDIGALCRPDDVVSSYFTGHLGNSCCHCRHILRPVQCFSCKRGWLPGVLRKMCGLGQHWSLCSGVIGSFALIVSSYCGLMRDLWRSPIMKRSFFPLQTIPRNRYLIRLLWSLQTFPDVVTLICMYSVPSVLFLTKVGSSKSVTDVSPTTDNIPSWECSDSVLHCFFDIAFVFSTNFMMLQSDVHNLMLSTALFGQMKQSV